MTAAYPSFICPFKFLEIKQKLNAHQLHVANTYTPVFIFKINSSQI